MLYYQLSTVPFNVVQVQKFMGHIPGGRESTNPLMFRTPYRLQTTGLPHITPTVTSIGMCYREINYITAPIISDRTTKRQTDQSRS